MLLNALCSAIGDDEPTVAQHLVRAAQALGAFVPVGLWLPLSVEAVTAEKAGPAQRANALVVFSSMLHAAGVLGSASCSAGPQESCRLHSLRPVSALGQCESGFCSLAPVF